MALGGGEASRVAGGGDTTVMGSSSWKETNPFLYKVIKTVFDTAIGGIAGAGVGGIVGMTTASKARRNPRAIASAKRTQALLYARVFSAVGGAQSGIESIMTGLRGKDDLTTHLVSGSGGGLVYSFVSQGLKGQPVHALSSAAGFAVVGGIFYEVRETIRSRINQEPFYTELRVMLLKLGLEEYEKNFKKGHLTDPTLPLLTDSELKEVNIPPGARLLILDHIKRYPKVKSKRGKQ